MVKEVLGKGQAKVKWGQIFNNVQFIRMKYQIVRLAVYMLKYMLLQNFDIHFLNNCNYSNLVCDYSGRMAIIDYKKLINRITV